MRCIRCHKDIDTSGAKYCPFCGALQVKKKASRQRGNGTGTAVKRGTTWEARVVVGWNTDGEKARPIMRSKRGFKTKKEALEYIPMLRGKRELHATLEHYWKIWSNDDMLALSQSKQTAYRVAYAKLGNIVHMDISNISVEQLKNAVADACPTYYTARDAKAVLRRLYALADADGIGNPRLPSYINLPRLDEKEGQAFTEQEIASLWSAYDSGLTDCGYILIMIYTGMMPGELCGLKQSSIDLQARQIVGAGMKTKVRRATPISIAEIIVPVIMALQDAGKNGRFLPCNRDTFYSRYHAACIAAGVRDLPPYSCRHTTATALAVGEDVSPEIIRKVMRWSNTKMLSRYAHPDISDAISAVNQIGRK